MKKRSWYCIGCWRHMRMPIAIRGPLAIPYRLIGLKISRMNPNLCNMCETHFANIKKAKTIVVPATVLFADIRGYTSLSEVLDSPKVARLLSGFYEACAPSIWDRDGIINKLIGDAILAVFNFPIDREDHVLQAVEAGIEVQKKSQELYSSLDDADRARFTLGMGVGIHTGQVSIGEVGEFCKDFTAVGAIVNMASRLQGSAKVGEVIVSEEVYSSVKDHFPEAEVRTVSLKNIANPVRTYVLHSKT